MGLRKEITFLQIMKMMKDDKPTLCGYHYYMTPEKASEGLEKFQTAVNKPVRDWSYKDYPYLPDMSIFKHDKV